MVRSAKAAKPTRYFLEIVAEDAMPVTEDPHAGRVPEVVAVNDRYRSVWRVA
jgi:hypothetical protein